MDDIDVLSNVLLELKKRIDKQDEIIERLAIEKASLADKLEHLSQKIEHITSLQKQGEKNFSQYTKELENLKNFSKNLNKIIDNRFDEIAKSLEIEKAKEKTKDLENMKELDQKIKQIIDLKKTFQQELENLEKRVKETLNERKKHQEKIIGEANAKMEKVFYEKLEHLLSLIKSNEKAISELKEKYEKDYRLHQAKLETASKVDQIINQTIEKVEDKVIELEEFLDKLNSKLDDYVSKETKKDEKIEKRFNSVELAVKSLNEKNVENRKEIEKELSLLHQKISEIENQLKSFSKNIEKLSQQVSSFKEANEDLSNRMQNLETSLHDFVKEREKAIKSDLYKTIDNAVLEFNDKISKISGLDANVKSLANSVKSIETEINSLKNRNSEEIRKIAKSEVETIITQINKDNEMIRQKMKQMETSFNIQVKASSNFYDMLKHDLNSLKNHIETLDSLIKNETENRVDLEQEFNDLSKYFNRIEESFSSLKSTIEERMKKHREEITQLNKNILNAQNEMLKHIEDVKAMTKDYSDKQYQALVRMIENVNKDKNIKEERRIERMNEIIKEFSNKSSLIDSKMELLSSHINRFNEIKNSFRKEIISEIKEMIKEIDRRQKNVETKFLLNDNQLNEIEKRIDRLDSKIQELSKEVAVWKERYKLQLGRIAGEVEEE